MTLWPPGTPYSWNYEQGLIMWAIEKVGDKNPDPKYSQYIQQKVDYLVNANGVISTYNVNDYNLDNVASGRALLFLYNKTGSAKYKLAADRLKAQLTNQPRTTSGGFWHKQIYPSQMWLDGLYMGEPFAAHYSTLFPSSQDYDDVALQFLLMNKVARDETTGLLYHGWDESKKQAWAHPITGCSPSFWGRAIGWYAMGLVDVLDYLPQSHPKRDSLILTLQELSTAIVKYQDSTGLWYQVTDKPYQLNNYREASASCMFVYALLKGARKGYLDNTASNAAKRGFDNIVKTFVEVDAQGNPHLNAICPVAGLGGTPYRSGTYDYYVGVKGVKDDVKGVGAFILAAVEMEASMTLNMDMSVLHERRNYLYPNPVLDKIHVSFHEDSHPCKVYNAVGQEVYTGTLGEINAQAWLPGLYFLDLSTNSKQEVLPFLKKD